MSRARARLLARRIFLVVGLLTSAAMVWHASSAAFNGRTNNPTNAWTAAALALTDDDTSSAMFAPTNLKPGSTGTRCLKVTYGASIASAVKIYTTASSYTGTLGTYIDLVVSEGPAGTWANGTCSNWTTGTQIYSGTLANFASTYTNFGNGLANPGMTWTPTSNGQLKVYKFVYTVQTSAPNVSQGTTSAIGFTWEAQNTTAVNLALNRTATNSAACNGSEIGASAVNGSVSDGNSDKLCTSAATKYLQVDLGSVSSITSFTVRHAGAGGESTAMNTRDFDIDVSSNGTAWTNVVHVTGNAASVTTHAVSTSGRYVKFTAAYAEQGSNTNLRLYEFEVY